MPTTPYAKATVSIDGGAVSTVAVSATGAQVARFRLESTVGVSAVRWELYDFPPTFACPSGWTDDTTNDVYYSTEIEPDDVTLGTDTPANFGKYMLRVAVNEARDYMSPLSDATRRASYASLIDETVAISVPDLDSGAVGIGLYEGSQFSATRKAKAAYDTDLRSSLGGGLSPLIDQPGTMPDNVASFSADGPIQVLFGDRPAYRQTIYFEDIAANIELNGEGDPTIVGMIVEVSDPYGRGATQTLVIDAGASPFVGNSASGNIATFAAFGRMKMVAIANGSYIKWLVLEKTGVTIT